MLFTPADRVDRFARAAASGADGVILDLEDGVGLPGKAAARAAAIAFLADAADDGVAWAVRLNHIATEAGLQDLLALRAGVRVPGIVVLPKTESVAEIDIALQHLARGDVLPVVVALIESGRGLSAAGAIAAHPGVGALAFGGVDLAADLHAEFTWEPMLFARSRMAQAAAMGGVAVWDVPFLDIADTDGLERETLAARGLGFGGKLAIHPGQVATINAAFSPDAAQVARAERVIEAFQRAGGGACQLDGKMVDAPVVKAAHRTLSLAARART